LPPGAFQAGEKDDDRGGGGTSAMPPNATAGADASARDGDVGEKLEGGSDANVTPTPLDGGSDAAADAPLDAPLDGSSDVATGD
jgi:hypothetical protein